MASVLTFLDVVLAALGIYLFRQFLARRRIQLPPGPTGLPLIGNVLDVPRTYESEVYSQWRKRFGKHDRSRSLLDMIYLHIP